MSVRFAVPFLLSLCVSIPGPGPSPARAQSLVDEPADHGLPAFVGEPATAMPLPPKQIPQHPGLAAVQSSIHVDLANTGVTDLQTPLGRDPVVTSRSFGSIGTCLNFVHDSEGRLHAFCGVQHEGEFAFELTLLDADSLDKLARYELLRFTLTELLALPLDLGYMVFDADDRFIAIRRDNRVQWVGLAPTASEPTYAVAEERDFAEYVDPELDKVAAVIPDHAGNLFYMTLGKGDGEGGVTTPARVGVLDPRSDTHVQQVLEGEIIENGMAVGPDGVFLLSDRALYGFRFTDGQLEQTFREPYDRASERKPGVISLGAGGTPTLMEDRYVVITDNADGRIHLLVYDRRPDLPDGTGRQVCKVPVFDEGASANENTVLVHGRSMLVQNWYGAPESILDGNHRNLVPGLVRIDLREDGSGCDQVWYTRELATPATIKLSTATGLVYSSMLDQAIEDVDAFYGLAIDFATGETRFRVRLGVGPAADIQFSPTYVAPDGAILQPVRQGVVKWQDGEAAAAPADAGVMPDGGAAQEGGLTDDGGSAAPADRDDDDGGCAVGGAGPSTWTWAVVLLLWARRRLRRPPQTRRA